MMETTPPQTERQVNPAIVNQSDDTLARLGKRHEWLTMQGVSKRRAKKIVKLAKTLGTLPSRRS